MHRIITLPALILSLSATATAMQNHDPSAREIQQLKKEILRVQAEMRESQAYLGKIERKLQYFASLEKTAREMARDGDQRRARKLTRYAQSMARQFEAKRAVVKAEIRRQWAELHSLRGKLATISRSRAENS